MRIFLYASITTESVRQDAAILEARGYDVLTIGDILDALTDPSPTEVMRTALLTITDLQRPRIVVLHPTIDPQALMDLVCWCRVMDTLVLRMDVLPAVAPPSRRVLNEHDLALGRFILPTLESTEARSLGDRLRAAYRSLRHWVARAKHPVRYVTNNTLTTTG